MPIGFQAFTGTPKLVLELTEPNKTENDDWEITATAIVSDDGKPTPSISVQFYHNGHTHQSPCETDGEGRATMTFSNLEKGHHTFEAVVAGSTIRSNRSVKLKDEKPKKAAKLVIAKEYAGEKIKITCTVLSDDDTPVNKSEVRVLGLSTPTSAKTDKSGTATMEVELEKTYKIVTIMVAGSSIKKNTHLYKKEGEVT